MSSSKDKQNYSGNAHAMSFNKQVKITPAAHKVQGSIQYSSPSINNNTTNNTTVPHIVLNAH